MSRNSEIPRVPGFLYLDMGRVKSISSRLDQGYIQQKVEEREESESVIESITGSIKASILGMGPTIEGEHRASSTQSSRVSQSKALHHYYFDLFEEWVEDQEGNWFHDVAAMKNEVGGSNALPSRFRSEVNEGDLVRVEGPIEFHDFDNSLDIISGFINNADALDGLILQQVKEGARKGEREVSIDTGSIMRNEVEDYKPVFDFFDAVVPDDYQNMVAATVELDGVSDLEFWMLIQDENLEYSTAELAANYSDNTIPNCTIIGRVESITEEQSEANFQLESEEDITKIFEMASDLAKELGFAAQYPAVSISPIAIYR